MKMPAIPPGFPTESQDVVQAIVQSACSGLEDSEYLHWDKLRHKSPPQGVTHEQWWWAIKYARKASRSLIPLTDKAGKPFAFSRHETIEKAVHEIDMNAGGMVGSRDPFGQDRAQSDRYLIHSLTEEAITSSQIEGAVTTREVAKEMLRTKRSPRDLGERMILNNFVTMRRIGEWKDQPMTPALLFEIHRGITDQTLDDPSQAGRLRRADEERHVMDEYNNIMHTPPNAAELEGRVRLMCDFANGVATSPFIHPIVRSIMLHFWLAYDHPFTDGNGRTARALFYWSMLRHGYWLMEYVSISQIIKRAQAQYGRAFLLTETDDNDLTYFILYHLELITRSIHELNEYIAKEGERQRAMESALRGMDLLNTRQRMLLSHAMKHPGLVYTIEGQQEMHRVAYATARADLLGLERMGLLQKSKAGRTFRFRAVADLTERLRNLDNVGEAQ